MIAEDQWIITRVGKARKLHIAVTEAASVRLEQLLRGQLSERQLSSTEIMKVAMALIADMVPAPPKGEANQ